MQPTLAQMRLAIAGKNPVNIQNIGASEAPSMSPKSFVSPDAGDGQTPPVGGVNMSNGMPVGGIDMSQQQAGQQMLPQSMMQPQGGLPQGQPQGPQGPQGAPLGAPAGAPPMGNMLSMTPQGQALGAMGGPQQPLKPQGMKSGGSAKSVAEMKDEIESKGKPEKVSSRILFPAEGSGGVKGIKAPRHMWFGSKTNEGMKDINKARADVYGSENRTPLTIGQVGDIHKKTLEEHFNKPIEQQNADEKASLDKLRAAKHLGKTANTLDESEKLDTVRHEHDKQGRTYIGFASKGVAGHALYTSGHGENQKHHILNTCPGQTTGCGGGVDEHGIVDTSKGTCFAPVAETQYAGAAIRRSCHEQAKHDPAMTKDWILAHTGSLRNAARLADRKNNRLLFRPNVVDETDVSSRHAIRHLNKQRKAEDKPRIIANSYGKTNELHDPENGYYVTHSNVGPKTKHGKSIAENIARDKQRVRNTITATKANGEDFKNDDNNVTPPKNSYMVTNVKRHSALDKKMQKSITHAKYWSTGRPTSSLSESEKEEGAEGHFNGNGKPTTPDKAHYGHAVVNDKRYDYQKQHILHSRLVQVGKNEDGTPHMIPTDSRFKDEDFLPKNRFKTKNGKNAGAILMTTPTESTSNVGHNSSFTHNVDESHLEHAKRNNGEYEIDSPHHQDSASGKEYVAPRPIQFKADGGSVHHGESFGDNMEFPEQSFAAMAHLAHRRDPDEEGDIVQTKAHGGHVHKRSVVVHTKPDTMKYEMIMRKKVK
jgi:hypothetical protein